MTALAVIGHNRPPEDTPFEAVKVHVEDLMVEAANWLDGSDVTSEADAEAVAKLLDMLRDAEKAREGARKAEVKPLDDAKAEVQARYNPLGARIELAVKACKRALVPWLTAKREAQEAEAARKAEAAQAAAQTAAQAVRKAAESNSLADLQAAQDQVDAAKRSQKDATRASKAKAHAAGGKRAVALTTSYETKMIDSVAAARWAWTADRSACEAFFLGLAKARVLAGAREIPGFAIAPVQGVV